MNSITKWIRPKAPLAKVNKPLSGVPKNQGRGTYYYIAMGGLALFGIAIPAHFYHRKFIAPDERKRELDEMYPAPVRTTPVFTAGQANNVIGQYLKVPVMEFMFETLKRLAVLLIRLIPVVHHLIGELMFGVSERHDAVHATLQLFEAMGPTYVKLGQWVASRPDIFPARICEKLGTLFDAAPEHPWEATEAALRKQDVLKAFSSIEKEPFNSGSVAQIHRAVLRDDHGRISAGTRVVVKVLHPDIEKLMLADLAVMQLLVKFVNWIPGVKYFSLQQNLEEFSSLLLSQLNLICEGENLQQFQHNFRYSENVAFPTPLMPLSSEEVLVETLEVGKPLHAVGPNAKVARVGCEMFMQMLFRDNFTHADLHPGNILIRYKDYRTGEIVEDPNATSLSKFKSHTESKRFGKAKVEKKVEDETRQYQRSIAQQEKAERRAWVPQVVVLDPGLITSLSDRERDNFLALFTAVACGDGDLGARLMLERSPEHSCTDVPKFQADMRKIFDAVGPGSSAGFSLSKIDIGKTLTQVFETMREHRVRIDGGFASLVVTVLVGESLGRKMHPNYNIFAEAAPHLVRELKGHELQHLICELQRVYGVKELVAGGGDAIVMWNSS